MRSAAAVQPLHSTEGEQHRCKKRKIERMDNKRKCDHTDQQGDKCSGTQKLISRSRSQPKFMKPNDEYEPFIECRVWQCDTCFSFDEPDAVAP